MGLTYADMAEYHTDCVTYQTSQHTPPSLSGDQHVNYELIKDLMDGNYQTIENNSYSLGRCLTSNDKVGPR